MLQLRGNRQTILENDVFAFLDAGRHGNEHDIISGFLNSEGKMMQREKRTIYVHYSEQSMNARRERNRGFMDVVEYMLIARRTASATGNKHGFLFRRAKPLTGPDGHRCSLQD